MQVNMYTRHIKKRGGEINDKENIRNRKYNKNEKSRKIYGKKDKLKRERQMKKSYIWSLLELGAFLIYHDI